MSTDEKTFLRKADQKAWERFTSGKAGWDYVIITASNFSQGEGFKAQIRERLEAGFLPFSAHYGVVPDPEGERVGNGGAVLGALRYVFAREGTFRELRILVILSSGDSRRAAQYSAVGKIFSPVPRTLPNGRASTLFDEAMIALSPIPDKITEGVLVISGDVMLSFDAESFDPGNADAAAIAFPEPAATGAGHGVFLRNDEGNIARVWHKQKPEVLKGYGAVDENGFVNIDTGAVFFSPRVAEALYSLVCDEEGRCTDGTFRRIVNGHLAPSLYVDFFYPLADGSNCDGYMYEIPEGRMSPELLELRKRIWRVLRPYRIRLCTLAPSRFIHFGTTADVAELMSAGIDEYAYLGWKKQVASDVDDPGTAAYNSYGRGTFGKNVYLEDCVILSGDIGDRVILSGLEINGETVPSDVVLHCLKLTDGRYVTRIYGIHDDPKCRDVRLFGIKPDLGDVWGNGDHDLWHAVIYPACGTMKESIDAALNLYALIHGAGNRTAWNEAQKESLYSSFCKADGAAIHLWQKKVQEKIARVMPDK